ncbi:hypothetical protein B9G55_05810 [Saccharibacillus sp. O16]|nr:hypothetical protein B9G55_05810 [Saccharibacillus sp. O16]
MELNDLHIFRSVARNGSMSKAAAELGYVQSNVTSRIRALEEEFGVRLLDRSPLGVTLRPEGERLLGYARQIHELIEQAKIEVPLAVPRSLRVGASQTLTAAYLHPAIRNPQSNLTIFTRTLEQLTDLLQAGQLDAILVNREPEQDAHLHLEKVFAVPEPIAWMQAASVKGELHPTEPGGKQLETEAERKPGIEPKPELPLLVARDLYCPYRRQTLRFLEHTSSRRPQIEADTLDSLVAIVESGHGIALLPRKLKTPRMVEVRLPGFQEEPVEIRCYRLAHPGQIDRPQHGIEAYEQLRLLVAGGAFETGANRLIRTGEEA